MNRALLAVLVLSSAFTAHAQAVRPAPIPVTGPLVVQQPPAFPANPPATPAGAGASHGGLAAPAKALAPPSPNKRLLPPTREVGLWAADGVSANVPAPQVFGVAIPYPANASADERAAVDSCSHTLAMAEHESRQADYMRTPTLDVRTCLAYQGLVLCVVGMTDMLRGTAPLAGFPADATPAVETVRHHALSLVERYCKGIDIAPEITTAYRKVEKQWYKTAKELRTPGTQH